MVALTPGLRVINRGRAHTYPVRLRWGGEEQRRSALRAKRASEGVSAGRVAVLISAEYVLALSHGDVLEYNINDITYNVQDT
jgi:hypothetical protein